MRKRYEMQGADTDPLEEYKEAKIKDSIHSVPTLVAFLFILLSLGHYGIVYKFDDILPPSLTVAQEKLYPYAFIAERAQHDLRMLTNIGTRVTGSYENEAMAVDFLKREITIIQHMMHRNHEIEMDVQTVSGSYYLNVKPHGVINAYANVQNVVVKLHAHNRTDISLLVNAHFDSVPTSPGGSDDGINCAVMLEILRKLTRSPTTFRHNIIFLFNGAEETPLQASHGFITKHKWAKEVRVVINLDSGGAEGKEELFQLGPNKPWLMNYYKKVPHPRAQSASEELFQSGLIPSDTDFRIFRDFGKIIGMDFAFIRNGYRYHTKFDGFSNNPLGSYQHVGDNALSLVRNLANAPEMENVDAQPNGQIVYYDFLGLFLVSYSETIAAVLNIGTVLLSLVVAFKSFSDFSLGKSLTYVFLSIGAILLGWIAAVAFVVIIAFIIDVLKFSMSWYANPWIILGLYVTPVILCSVTPIVLLRNSKIKDNLSISAQTQIQAHLLRLLWTLPLLIGTLLGYRFIYAMLIPVLFQTFAFLIIQTFSLQHSVRKWQITYVLCTIIPNTFSMSQAIKIMYVIIPICGRIGSDRNPDILIAILAFLLTLLVWSFYIPLATLIRKPSIVLKGLLGLFAITLIFVLTPLAFPYTGNPGSPAPQRFVVFHTGRIFHNETNDVYKKDAGFYVLNMDRNSPNSIKKHVKDLDKLKSVAADCKETLFCGLPVAAIPMIPYLHESTWIPAGQPIIHEPVSLKLNSRTVLTDSVIRFNLTASGPDRLVIYLSPKTNVTLSSTSLTSDSLTNPIIWNGRPSYAILYACGKENVPLNFHLDFQTPLHWNGPAFDIAVTGRYMHDKTHVKTPHYLKFLSEFPDWADVIAWLAYYENWVF